MARLYYLVDLILAAGFPLLVWLLLRRGRVPSRSMSLFGLGFGLGLLWEIPIFGFSAYSDTPLILWTSPLPLPPWIYMLLHCSWDGMILLGGWWMALWLERRVNPQGLSAAAPGPLSLLVLVLWGQVTALLVELSSIAAGAWVWVEGYAWNPVLLRPAGEPIGGMIFGVWLLASIVFWVVARRWTEAKGEGLSG